MRKKVTNEEVGEVIEKLAEKIRSDMDYEFRVAQSQMWIAENDLIDALEEKQYEAYRNYVEKREAFFSDRKRTLSKKILIANESNKNRAYDCAVFVLLTINHFRLRRLESSS